MESFFLAFIPLFVAIDVLGVMPLFMGLTESTGEAARRRLTLQATLTAFAVSLIFLVAGKLIFSFLGISEADFRVGGGIVLLALAVTDLLRPPEFTRMHAPADQGAMPRESTLGIVPIGIPLIMGPAALTTILVLVDAYGYIWTIISLVVNLAIVWVVFRWCALIARVVGKAASLGVAKVAALLLTGIAVMMIRSGIQMMLGSD